MNPLNEQNLTEQSLIEWLQAQGFEYTSGSSLSYGQPNAEREDEQFRDVVLKGRLLRAVRRLNPQLPSEQAEHIVQDVANYYHSDLILGNKEMYDFIIDGVKKTWREEGNEKTETVKLIDFADPIQMNFW